MNVQSVIAKPYPPARFESGHIVRFSGSEYYGPTSLYGADVVIISSKHAAYDSWQYRVKARIETEGKAYWHEFSAYQWDLASSHKTYEGKYKDEVARPATSISTSISSDNFGPILMCIGIFLLIIVPGILKILGVL